MNNVILGFILKPVLVSLDNLLLSKPLLPSLQETSKYRQIKASIEEVGLIEPLTICWRRWNIDQLGMRLKTWTTWR